MPVELTATQRRVAIRFSRLVHDLSGERIATELGVAAQQRFDDVRFAQLLIQLHLKHVEMSKALISTFRQGLFSPTAALTRPLLEGAAKLCWAPVMADVAEQRRRLLRIVLRSYVELDDQGVELPPGERALVDEARAANLRAAPDVRGAMRSVDAVRARIGEPPFLEGTTASTRSPQSSSTCISRDRLYSDSTLPETRW